MMNNNCIIKKVEQSHLAAISIHCLKSHLVKFVQQPSYLRLESVWLGREDQILGFSLDLFIVNEKSSIFHHFFNIEGNSSNFSFSSASYGNLWKQGNQNARHSASLLLISEVSIVENKRNMPSSFVTNVKNHTVENITESLIWAQWLKQEKSKKKQERRERGRDAIAPYT